MSVLPLDLPEISHPGLRAITAMAYAGLKPAIRDRVWALVSLGPYERFRSAMRVPPCMDFFLSMNGEVCCDIFVMFGVFAAPKEAEPGLGGGEL